MLTSRSSVCTSAHSALGC